MSQSNPSAPQVQASRSRYGLRQWHESVLDQILRLAVLIATPALAAEAIIALGLSHVPWALYSILSLAIIYIIMLAPLPRHLRAIATLTFFGLNAVLNLWQIGMIGSGRIFTIFFVFLAALLLARRGAMIATGLICLIAVAIFLGQASGLIAAAATNAAGFENPQLVLINLISLLIFAIATAWIVIAMIARLTGSFRRAEATLAEREALNSRLEAMVAARTGQIERQLALQRALADCSHLLLSRDTSEAEHRAILNQALATVLRVVGGDHALVARYPDYSQGLDRLIKGFRTIATAALSGAAPQYAETPEVIADMPDELNVWKTGGSFNGPLAGRFPDHPVYSRYLEANRSQAAFIQALKIEGRPWGHILITDCTQGRTWDEAAVQTIRTAADMIMTFVEGWSSARALREREQLLSSINDALPDGYIYQLIQHDDGSYEGYTYVSAGIERLFGVTPEQFLASEGSFLELIAPEDRARFHRADMASVRASSTFEIELRARKADGSLGWFHLRSVPMLHLPGGRTLWSGICLEISARKQTELALAAREAQLRAVGDNLPNGFIYQYRRDGAGQRTFTYLSGGIESMWGATTEEVLRCADSVFARLAQEDRERMQGAEDSSAANMEILAAEVRHRMPDDSLRWAYLCAQPQREPDGSTSWNGVAIDITERQQAAEELRRAKEAAEAADAAKSTFLANMSHEIRTPLNAVIGMADMLLETDLSAEQHEYADTISTAGQALLSLINDILDLSRIEAGRLELDMQPFDLRACLHEARDMVAHVAAAKGLQLDYKLDASLPAGVIGDASRLRQVLINLLSNAVKFTNSGRVALLADAYPLEAGRQRIEITVRDSGIGISPDKQEQIFKPFIQADRSTARRYGGTGLGLAICRQIVALMEGQIHLESAPGIGSTFTVTIPFRVAAPPAATAHAPEAASARPGPGLKILVAEDNLINQQVTLQLLARLGHAVTLVDSGQAAIDALRSAPFDAVLMDVQMPEMDGEEATRRVRALGHTIAQPYIIALTANALPGDRERFLRAGMDDYLSKPVRQSELGRALASMAEQGAAPINPDLLNTFFESISSTRAEAIAFVVQMFEREVYEQLLQLDAAIGANDSARARKEAHRQRGGYLQIGARALAEQCRRIEQAEVGADLQLLGRQMWLSYHQTLSALRRL